MILMLMPMLLLLLLLLQLPPLLMMDICCSLLLLLFCVIFDHDKRNDGTIICTNRLTVAYDDVITNACFLFRYLFEESVLNRSKNSNVQGAKSLRHTPVYAVAKNMKIRSLHC
uniref:Secreted protein n=1 Tax=Glossina brevipalpis TaxID=37001 RepID=A0A1A9WJC1_9MUSC